MACRNRVLMTACLPTFSFAARSSSSRNMPCVRSTFTRRTGPTTSNWFVKNFETSWPRLAISAISSAECDGLDLFGISVIFLFGCLPCRDQTIELKAAYSTGLRSTLSPSGAPFLVAWKLNISPHRTRRQRAIPMHPVHLMVPGMFLVDSLRTYANKSVTILPFTNSLG